MIIECPKCNTKKKLRISDELRGKTLTYKCKTVGCENRIKINIPPLEIKDEKRNTVILTGTNIANSSAVLNQIDDTGDLLQSYKIDIGTNIIGRKSATKKVDIAIKTEDKFMSRAHCTITATLADDSLHFIIKDYQSKNDTYINNQLLQKNEEVYLQNNDVIQIGITKLVFQIN